MTAVSKTWLADVARFRQSFNLQDRDWQQTAQLKADIATHLMQNPGAGLSRTLFDRIVTWKLDNQEHRTSHHRLNLTDDLIRKITACAFSLTHPDGDFLAEIRLNTLSSFPGISIGVASAILALTFPNDYGVIDPRVWKQVYGEIKSGFSTSDYRKYLGDLLNGASQLRWVTQELDFFTWKMP